MYTHYKRKENSQLRNNNTKNKTKKSKKIEIYSKVYDIMRDNNEWWKNTGKKENYHVVPLIEASQKLLRIGILI